MSAPNQATLISRVRAVLGESEVDFYFDSHIATWLDDGQNHVAIRLTNEAAVDLTRVQLVNMPAGRKTFELPTDYLRTKEIEYGIPSYVCRFMTAEKLRAIGRNKYWIPAATMPIVWLEGPSNEGAGISGPGTMAISPVAAAASSVTHRYIAVPTITVNAGTPKLPDICYWPVVLFAAARAKEREASFEEARHFQGMCDEAIAAINGGGSR